MQDFPESISIFHFHREMYISGNEAGKADVQKGHLENLVKSVNTKSEELQLGPKSEIGTSLGACGMVCKRMRI